METLAAFYFSGTGNTRYIALRLCEKLSGTYATRAYDVCGQGDFASALRSCDRVLLAFPVYGSSPPVPMRRFVYRYAEQLRGKKAIVVATQYMFSGDGAASLGRTVERLGATVTHAEHFDMPNNLSDCTVFAVRNGGQLNGTLAKAERRMDRLAQKIARGTAFRRGFNPVSHAVGYFCQRKFWRRREKEKFTALRVQPSRCIGCGICAGQCPVNNIKIENGVARPQGNCALCYRCVNLCPKKAVTLFGKNAPQTQYKGINRK